MKQTIIDDCLKKVENRFELVRMVSSRAKQLTRGKRPTLAARGDKKIVVSMREIAEGNIFRVKEEPNENAE